MYQAPASVSHAVPNLVYICRGAYRVIKDRPLTQAPPCPTQRSNLPSAPLRSPGSPRWWWGQGGVAHRYLCGRIRVGVSLGRCRPLLFSRKGTTTTVKMLRRQVPCYCMSRIPLEQESNWERNSQSIHLNSRFLSLTHNVTLSHIY